MSTSNPVKKILSRWQTILIVSAFVVAYFLPLTQHRSDIRHANPSRAIHP
jgi:hypothetical protein